MKNALLNLFIPAGLLIALIVALWPVFELILEGVGLIGLLLAGAK